MAKDGEAKACGMLAKDVAKHRKCKQRVVNAKVQIQSVDREIEMMISQMKMADAIKTSAKVMQGMNELMKAPGVAEAMADMSKEMATFGLIDEAMDAALESAALDGEDVADADADAVLAELTGQPQKAPVMPAVPSGGYPTPAKADAASYLDQLDPVPQGGPAAAAPAAEPSLEERMAALQS